MWRLCARWHVKQLYHQCVTMSSVSTQAQHQFFTSGWSWCQVFVHQQFRHRFAQCFSVVMNSIPVKTMRPLPLHQDFVYSRGQSCHELRRFQCSVRGLQFSMSDDVAFYVSIWQRHVCLQAAAATCISLAQMPMIFAIGVPFLQPLAPHAQGTRP